MLGCGSNHLRRGLSPLSVTAVFLLKRRPPTRSTSSLALLPSAWLLITTRRTHRKATDKRVTDRKAFYKDSAALPRLAALPSRVYQSSVHTVRWATQGFRLFFANLRVSLLLVRKKLEGRGLTRREHRLLVATTNDTLKLVPFSLFLIVPFAELLLPVVLWLWPNMLPSTFAAAETDAKLERKFAARAELATFLQEMVAERTKQVVERSANAKLKDRAKALQELQAKLLQKAQKEKEGTGSLSELVEVNPFLSLEDLLAYSKLFSEEFKLEKLPTPTLEVLCKILGVTPIGMRGNVILQLRFHLLRLQREDRDILWEGVDSLTSKELSDACKDRAMKFVGLSDEAMRQQLRHWLSLSSHREIPPLLLVWSRCLTMTHRMPDLVAEAAAALSDAESVPLEEVEAEEETAGADEAESVLEASEDPAGQKLEELRAEAEALRGELATHGDARHRTTENKEETVAGSGGANAGAYAAASGSSSSPSSAPANRAQAEAKLEALAAECSMLRQAIVLQNQHAAAVMTDLVGLLVRCKPLETDGGGAAERPSINDVADLVGNAVNRLEQASVELSVALEARSAASKIASKSSHE